MLQELFSTMRVVALPTKTNFRGIHIREVALFIKNVHHGCRQLLRLQQSLAHGSIATL